MTLLCLGVWPVLDGRLGDTTPLALSKAVDGSPLHHAASGLA
jgi:hypothetical protein